MHTPLCASLFIYVSVNSYIIKVAQFVVAFVCYLFVVFWLGFLFFGWWVFVADFA